MLFRKKIKKSCAYCTHGVKVGDDEIVCSKKGIRSATDKCFKFKYDPLKRIPVKPKPLDFDKYNEEDFSL